MSEEDAQWERQKAAVDSFLDQQWIESRKKMHEAAEQSAMTWTTEKPTKEGWYWYREDGKKPEIVQCYLIDPVEGPMFWEMGCEQDFHGNSMDGEWYGPIEPPTE